ncbi:MAG: hypothetical protein DWQ05_16900 [Calditrichaeota bacterium]|nr:MAG: hypothetical protein DWQ05_16900 [Calditrichota bacterium]
MNILNPHYQRIKLCLCLLFIFTANLAAQESVDVPQQLQDDVREVYLTFDSLKSLSKDIRTQTQGLLKEVQRLQRQLALQKKGSRNYKVYRRQYEVKLAEYLAYKHDTLQDMQELRLKTIDALERILASLNQQDGGETRALQEKINKQLRQNEERIVQVKLEMLELLNELDDKELGETERSDITRKYYQLQNNRLALYQQHKTRFSQLLTVASSDNSHLPLMRKSLVGIHETLRYGFDWIEIEKAYIELYAGHRQQWLKTDQKLTEVSGLMEQFGELIEAINGSSSLLRDVEQFDKQVTADDDSQVFLPTLPELQWPGRPEQVTHSQPLSPAMIDSLKHAIESELQAEKN